MVKSLVKEIMGPCSAADLRDFSKEVAQISKNKDKVRTSFLLDYDAYIRAAMLAACQ